MTALYVAVKFHEEYSGDDVAFEPVDAGRLLAQLRIGYSTKEVNRMEKTLLEKLDWNLLLPTMDRFLQSMLAVIGATHLANSPTLRDNLEAVICHWPLVGQFRASVLALALLSLMLSKSSIKADEERVTSSLRRIFKVSE